MNFYVQRLTFDLNYIRIELSWVEWLEFFHSVHKKVERPNPSTPSYPLLRSTLSTIGKLERKYFYLINMFGENLWNCKSFDLISYMEWTLLAYNEIQISIIIESMNWISFPHLNYNLIWSPNQIISLKHSFIIIRQKYWYFARNIIS